ncbi:hypothetical protein RB623_24200 [Mesorhizobium sp. LHD-90]|uniref:hypothetical protein n=1 Tax=Mesorhizobium sp. LHD-90 TaxID=3071414 RepID=UPI0027DED405|nr:hypothetical protein [Mesorhizobium sp. LHD-90]MDQ6437167.1 hypothetical protein [Mesorhizobium sp. LHD-90]
MSALFIALGRRFGRFAVLLLALPAIVAVGFWVTLLDDYTIWFFLGAFIAVPLAMMTVASLLGLLFAGFRHSKEKCPAGR